jgi:uncharacterized protein (DUF2147 family)
VYAAAARQAGGVMVGARGHQRFVWLLSSLAVLAIWQSGQLCAAQPSAASKSSDALIGEWWTEKNEGRVRFSRDKDGTFRGTTTCCLHKNDPNNPERDIHNPNPTRRSRANIGIVIIWKLRYDDGEYVDGYVYNPRDGKTYRIEVKLLDGETLKIRGYLAIPLLGQSQIWKRAHLEAHGAATAAGR